MMSSIKEYISYINKQNQGKYSERKQEKKHTEGATSFNEHDAFRNMLPSLYV